MDPIVERLPETVKLPEILEEVERGTFTMTWKDWFDLLVKSMNEGWMIDGHPAASVVERLTLQFQKIMPSTHAFPVILTIQSESETLAVFCVSSILRTRTGGL